jgi:hypothetical protein
MRATILALPLVVFLAVDATAQVVALGTSGTRGVVSSDEAWTTLLERMLGKRHQREREQRGRVWRHF